MSGYVFHCTPCGKPHAGECPKPEPKKPVDRGVLDELQELVRALEGGSYNAAPTTLHQCKRDPRDCDVCYPPGTYKVDGVKVDGDTLTISARVRMATPLQYIPIVIPCEYRYAGLEFRNPAPRYIITVD